MSKVLVSAAGGGTGSDDCTASSAEVLKGYTAVTRDSDDEAVEGTLELDGTAADSQVLEGKTYYNVDAKSKRTGNMKNNGEITGSLSCGQSLNIPSGFTTGGTVTAASLASQTPGNAYAGAILTGYNAWVNGVNVAGGIPTYGGQTVQPQTYAQTLGIAGHYNSGNVVINPFPLPPAEYLKKGVNWYGVVGTHNGWVADPTDLYLYGNNMAGWQSIGDVRFESGQIYYNRNASSRIYTSSSVLLSGFSRFNVYLYVDSGIINGNIQLRRGANTSSTGTSIGYIGPINIETGTYNTYSFDISPYNIQDTLEFFITLRCFIYHIWLS